MPDSDGLSFLKEHSIPDQNLKNLIAICESVESAFALLDTQFGDKAGEVRQIKRQICELPILPDNYDFEVQLNVLKKILRYLTLFTRLFSPEEDLNECLVGFQRPKPCQQLDLTKKLLVII